MECGFIPLNKFKLAAFNMGTDAFDRILPKYVMSVCLAVSNVLSVQLSPYLFHDTFRGRDVSDDLTKILSIFGILIWAYLHFNIPGTLSSHIHYRTLIIPKVFSYAVSFITYH